MLRSPLTLVAAHRGSLVAVLLALAGALFIMAVAATMTSQARAGLSGWWDLYQPVIYLESDARDTMKEALIRELEEWPQIGAVEWKSGEEALERLVEELGADEVAALGIRREFLPQMLVVEPRVWSPSEVELMSRLQALEVRPEVVAVDVPDPRAVAQLRDGRTVLLGLGLGLLIFFLASWGNLAIFLRRLQEEERRENHLLEVFGASPGALSRPTTLRGAVIGGAAGLLSGVMFLPWAISLDSFVAGVAGAGALSAAPAAVVAMALPVVGLLLGGLVGRASARPRRSDASVGMESLLGWEREVG